MSKLRLHGGPPYSVAALHGGPGAAGAVSPLAKKLSKVRGIIEPFQSGTSIEGQVEELNQTLLENGISPFTVIGHSWGAWLGFIFAAKYPEHVEKLILVSSGPFEKKYTSGMMETRLGRLDTAERETAQKIMQALEEPSTTDNEGVLSQLGALLSKADSFDPMPDAHEEVEFQTEIYRSVWPEADALRESGELLALGKSIRCPVIAIHGDYDPHPAAGVKEPLSRVIENFEFSLLEKCGHEPWVERHAAGQFLELVTGLIER